MKDKPKHFRLILFALLIITVKTTNGQVYSVGSYACDTITTKTMQSTAGNCVTYAINTSLRPYVTGLTLNLKILNIYPCDTCISYYNGSTIQPLTIGDTLEFYATPTSGGATCFQFYFNTTDTISYQVLALGTPTIINEPYYCNPDVYFLMVFDACSGLQLHTIDASKNCFVGSTTTNINLIDSSSDLLFYPNPITDYFMVNEIGTIEIYDVLGNKIFQSEIAHSNFEINLSPYPNGIYFVKFYTTNKIYTGKIMKQ
jgi:hypothetical protein